MSLKLGLVNFNICGSSEYGKDWKLLYKVKRKEKEW